MKRLFTSESVTEGHPDKMCDQISDAILDEILSQDKFARVACETFTTTGLVGVMGEITTSAYVDIQKIVRETVKEIGYTDAKYGFDYKTCAVINAIDEQSTDIAMGVNDAIENRGNHMDEISKIGAGDQGMMFGYACEETEELMPLPISLAHKLSYRLAQVRKDGTVKNIRPDGKTQVTVEYDEKGNPLRIDTILISTQHDEELSMEKLAEDMKKFVVQPVINPQLIDKDTKFLFNPTGRFVIGGPHGDSGLTGRKIIVDTYGGYSRHGGGAFSGKDPTKVDRAASYAARWVAKNVVAAKLSSRCEVQLAYAIGKAEPLSVRIDTFGTNNIDEEKIMKAVERSFDLRPGAIIRDLDLRRPIYKKTASYGHFGRDGETFTWEKLNKVEELKKNI